MERWARREKKRAKLRGGMQVSGIGVKKVILPLIERKAADAEKSAGEKRSGTEDGASAPARRARKRR
jgi:hypothetical protein